jgi:glycosyltransferase involved in cell wall biosynthesis
MPVYNVEKYVEKALLSALNQTYENIEFIIVDDKGQDDSMDIVRRVVAEHPRASNVRIIAHEKNIGLGATRNTGIENATGDFIFFMDSDDEISPDCIEKLYAKMQENAVDFVIGSTCCLERTGKPIASLIYNDPPISGRLAVAHAYFERRNKSLPVYTWNKLFNLDFLRKNHILCYPNHLNEDNIFSFQVFLCAQSCAFIPDITYYYFDTPESIMSKLQSGNINARFGRQYAEISAFFRDYSQKFRSERIYASLVEYTINQQYAASISISDSRKIKKNEKREFLKETTKFPLKFSDIGRLKRNRLFFYIMWFAFKMPFRISLFKLIFWLSAIKKKCQIRK